MQLTPARDQQQKMTPYTVNFRGFNGNPVVQQGELTAMQNMSSDMLPCLSPRGPRQALYTLATPNGLFAKTQLCWVDGTNFVYNNVVKGTVTSGEKCFAAFNNIIVIFPDKKYYDVALDQFGSMENSYVSLTNKITFGTNTITTTGADFSGFSVGDGVTISGCTANTVNNITAIVQAVSAKVLTFKDNVFTAGAESPAITIKRAVPDIDFACEHENRLWGVKGDNIYASKLGNFKNWNVFDGVNTDSYATTAGTDGSFTAAVSYSNHPVFFKDNYIHEAYGYKPSNFIIQKTVALGVQSGSSKSAVVVNGILLYKSIKGIMAWTGGLPQIVSQNFFKTYSKAVAGTDDRKYYVSLFDGVAYTLMVLDTWNGNVWEIEDSLNVKEFAKLDGSVYALSNDDKKIYKFNSGTETISWSATTEEFIETDQGKEGHSKIGVKADMEIGSVLNVYLSIDNGDMQLINTITASEKRTILCPVIPQRAESFKVKLSGTGKVVVYSIRREFYVGSDA